VLPMKGKTELVDRGIAPYKGLRSGKAGDLRGVELEDLFFASQKRGRERKGKLLQRGGAMATGVCSEGELSA